MSSFHVVCGQCQHQFCLEELEPGNVQVCPECDGMLSCPGKLILSCDNCNLESDPIELDILEAVPCLECGTPMKVKRQILPEEEAYQKIEISDNTIGLVSSYQPEEVDEEEAPVESEPDAFSAGNTIALAGTTNSESESSDILEEIEEDIPLAEIEEEVPPEEQTIRLAGDDAVVSSSTLPSTASSSTPPPEGEEENKKPDFDSRAGTLIIEEDKKEKKTFQGGGINKETFGKYKILHEIARGGMGIVYRVYDPDLRRHMALKVLLQGDGATEITIKRFLREARSAANLLHPNIIAVHEMGDIDGQYFFTMDFIEGESFQDIIRGDDYDMSDKEFIQHMRKVCLALQAAHDKGVIHRDLKPANIMLKNLDKEVILMDFGLAKDNTSLSIQSITGSVFGSPAYMSPEQAQGQTYEIDHRSDIYSMGVIIYEGLTKKQPFQGETAFETMSMVVNDEPIPPHTIAPGAVNRDMQNIILKCMEKDPEKRYQQVGDLAKDLDAYLEGDTVSARSVNPAVRIWRKIRRKPLVLAGVIASPLVFVAIIAGWFLFSRPAYVELAEQALKSSNIERQIGALGELTALLKEGKIKTEDEKAKALQLFRQNILNKTPEVAVIAMKAAASFFDVQAYPNLVKIVIDPHADTPLRIRALQAISEIETREKTGNKQMVRILLNMANEENLPAKLRFAAIKTLIPFRAPGIIDAMTAIAKNPHNPVPLRVASLQVLQGRILMESAAMKDILDLYGDDDEQVALAAKKVLRKARSNESILAFYGLKDIIGNAYAKIADIKKMESERNKKLMELINDNGVLEAKKVSPLKAMLKKLEDKDPSIRMAAAYDLGQLGNGEAVPRLTEHLTDPANSVRKVAARAIVTLAPEKKPNMYKIRNLLKSREMLVREQGAYIIGELQDEQSFSDLLDAANREKSRRVISAMAKAFQRLENEKALPVLLKMLKICSGKSRSASENCIKAMASFEEPAVFYLIKALSIKDRKTRQTLVHTLKEITGEDFGTDTEKWEAWWKKQ